MVQITQAGARGNRSQTANRQTVGRARLGFIVLFPQDLVEREVLRLRHDLRGLFTRLQRDQIGLEDCLRFGEDCFTAALKRIETGLHKYFSRYGVVFNPAFDRAIWEVFLQALVAWQRVCRDYVGNKQDENLLLMYKPGSISEQGVARWDAIDTSLLVLTGYWLTRVGLNRRVDLVSEDFTYNLVNVCMLNMAEMSGASLVHWQTEEDDRVCAECYGYGRGGERHDGYYLLDDPLRPEPPPVHPNCRCRYNIIFKFEYVTNNVWFN